MAHLHSHVPKRCGAKQDRGSLVIETEVSTRVEGDRASLLSEKDFHEYIVPKLDTLRTSGARVFVKMGNVRAYGEFQPKCFFNPNPNKILQTAFV